MKNLDWNLARAFHATAEHGSLSAASRSLGLTQPTLSRQVAELEKQLGVTLFERVGKKLVLTETGLALKARVHPMSEAAAEFELTASGLSDAVTGKVIISATDAYSAYIIPRFVAQLQAAAPEVTLVFISSNSISDLRRREADIAIRHVRPGDDELVGKLIGTAKAYFYASEAWVARHGMPRGGNDLRTRDILGAEDGERFAGYLRGIDISAHADDFRILSENSVVLWEMAKTGAGVCNMFAEIGDKTPGMVRVVPDIPPIPVPLWLVTHRELRTSKRIRLVYDVLAEQLAKRV